VQSVLPLRDGSALRLTTSRYFTPSGRTIQDTGISPDIIVEQQEAVKKSEQDRDKEKNIEKVFEDVEGKEEADSKEEVLKKRYFSDTQLSRAVDLLKSIKVYKNIFPTNSKTAVKTP
jgi:carboxyl-terminal processing protease